MSARTYTLVVTDNELLLLLFGLGSWSMAMPVSTPADREHPALAHALACRLLDLHHASGDPPAPVPTPTAQASLPLTNTYHFAKDRSGKSYTTANTERLEATITKVERKDTANGARLAVTMVPPERASVWDESIFAHVSSRVKQKSVFFIVRKDKFVNIVGVMA